MYSIHVAIVQNSIGNESYEKAYMEMADMLDGKIPMSIRRAVFMAEWAYLDGNLDYEKDYRENTTCNPKNLINIITLTY